MNSERLARLEDLTRRYARYRPCGAGLGAMWGGSLLALLAALFAYWALTAYADAPVTSAGLWRFLRGSPLVPPGWLVLTAALTPFVAWAGLRAIQDWVDVHFGAVEGNEPCDARLRGPHWMAPFLVVMVATLLCGIILWDAAAGSAWRGLAGILAIGAWTFVWGRASRDRLTQMVMLAVSVPPLYVLASTDAESKMAAGNVMIFAAYLLLMTWLLVKGATRFSGFLKVRRDLAAIQPVDE